MPELSLGHPGGPGSLFHRTTTEFARRVNRALEGRARLVVFGSAQLGTDQAMLQKLKLGTADLMLASTVLASEVEAFALFELPYLVRDREHVARIRARVVRPDLGPAAEEAGYRLLAVWENGFRHVTNDLRPVRIPEDLRGLRLRTPRSPWRLRLFRAYGANPTPMPFSELFVALQTGVVDGQENPLQQIWGARLHEVQEHLALTGHVYSPAYLIAGARRWSRLPADVRGVLEREARALEDWALEEGARMESAVLDSLRSAGMRVTRGDRARFRAAGAEAYRAFREEVPGGGRMLEKVEELEAPGAEGG